MLSFFKLFFYVLQHLRWLILGYTSQKTFRKYLKERVNFSFNICAKVRNLDFVVLKSTAARAYNFAIRYIVYKTVNCLFCFLITLVKFSAVQKWKSWKYYLSIKYFSILRQSTYALNNFRYLRNEKLIVYFWAVLCLHLLGTWKEFVF